MHVAFMPDLMVYVSGWHVNVCTQTILAPRMGSQVVRPTSCPVPVIQRLAFGITRMSNHYNSMGMGSTVPAHLF
jgi:hypothetical protein